MSYLNKRSGPRSNFIYNKVERKSTHKYFNEFHDFLTAGDFVKSGIETPVREEFMSDELDYALFKLLKHDFRMKYIEIVRCLGLSKTIFYNHLHNVLERCSFWTPYFPKGYPDYNGYFILFRTDNEKQLVEQLGKRILFGIIFVDLDPHWWNLLSVCADRE